MSEYLILIVCAECGAEEYFEIDNLPGGREHCPYCAECGALLPLPPNNGLHATDESRLFAQDALINDGSTGMRMIEKDKLQEKLFCLEDKIIELQEEADKIRVLLAKPPRLTLGVSGLTIQQLDKLCKKWGDDRETALLRCIERASAA